jgi:hypothetical protein
MPDEILSETTSKEAEEAARATLDPQKPIEIRRGVVHCSLCLSFPANRKCRFTRQTDRCVPYGTFKSCLPAGSNCDLLGWLRLPTILPVFLTL